MTGATGNIYCGLHEFAEMGFLLHALRPDDLFVDIGANVGSYTVLASAVVGARSYAFEPGPEAFRHLCENLRLNDIGNRVRAFPWAIGSAEGEREFFVGHDTMNHIATEQEQKAGGSILPVPVRPLDLVLEKEQPRLIMIDVEGFESEVIRGAESIFLRDGEPLAVIMETNGSGRRYGYEDAALFREMEERFGFGTFRYYPLRRELEALDRDCAPDGNTLFLTCPSFFRGRVESAPAFPIQGQDV
jgi:FkbM family methyltransferase